MADQVKGLHGCMPNTNSLLQEMQETVNTVQETVGETRETAINTQETVNDTQGTANSMQETVNDTQETVNDMQETVANLLNSCNYLTHRIDTLEATGGHTDNQLAVVDSNTRRFKNSRRHSAANIGVRLQRVEDRALALNGTMVDRLAAVEGMLRAALAR